MKFVSYTRCGYSGFGLVVDGGIVELAGRLDVGVTTLRQAICADILALAGPYAKGRGAELGWSDLTLLPVIPDPAKILCIGLNYQKHKEETGRPDVDNPTIFTRFSDTQVGHGQPLEDGLASKQRSAECNESEFPGFSQNIGGRNRL